MMETLPADRLLQFKFIEIQLAFELIELEMQR